MQNAIYIVLLSIVLVILLAISVVFKKSTLPLVLKITGNNVTETIKPWSGNDGKWYFFIPSYSSENNTVLIADKGKCYLEGSLLSNDKAISLLKMNTEYHFERHSLLSDWDTTIVFLKSDNIASMYIDTRSGNMDKIHSDKKNSEQVNVSLYDNKENQLYFSNSFSDKIRGHGNSTWLNYEKKAYNLYLSEPQTFWENESCKNWVLLANYSDKSKIRNRVVFDIAKDTSTVWSPVGDYVDLFLNNEYVGQYYLVEKVEVAENKIQLQNDEILLNLELTSRADDYCINELFQGVSAEICYPQNIPQESLVKICENIKEIIKTVSSGNATDDYLKTHIDLDSWAWMYVLEELSCDFDAGVCSQYFSFDGTMLKAQTAWDYDNTFGASIHKSPSSFLADRTYKDSYTDASWFHSLLQYDVFNKLVKKQFEEMFYPKLQTMLDGEIQQECKRIRESSLMDEVRWSSEDEQNKWHEDIDYVQNFIDKRVAFLTSAWIDDVNYHTICIKGSWQYLYFSVRNNTVFEEIPQAESIEINNLIAWIDERTGQRFDPDQIITEDKILSAFCDEKADETVSPSVSDWIELNKPLVISAVLCSALVFIGAVLVYFDNKRNRKATKGNGR